MSRLNKSIPIIEPADFEELEEKSEAVAYLPQHPMLAFHAEQQASLTPDHLENYEEVTPFQYK